jgi:Mce-associated membrane protein
MDADLAESPDRPWLAWTIMSLVVAVLVLAGVSGALGLDVRANSRNDARDHAALAAANRIAVQLVTLDHSSAKQNLEAIAADSTGSFRDQWQKISGNFASVLENGKVQSTGEVKESGLVDIDDAHATVLTAVTSTVKNTEAPEGQQRVYRMKMTLDHSDDHWLVSNVEFVA